MTRHHKDTTDPKDPINLLLEHGLSEGLPQIAEMLMNAAMLIEPQRPPQGGPLRTQRRAQRLRQRIERPHLPELGRAARFTRAPDPGQR
jgi:hypothetical protein